LETKTNSERFGAPADCVAAEVEQVSEQVNAKRPPGGPSVEVAFTSSLDITSRFIILPNHRERAGAVRQEVL
jgi:hypothetical protein